MKLTKKQKQVDTDNKKNNSICVEDYVINIYAKFEFYSTGTKTIVFDFCQFLL